MDCNENFNSIYMINGSNNMYFITENLGNILVHNFDEFFQSQLYSYLITYPEWSALMLETQSWLTARSDVEPF
jgi:hypothetical protein